MEPVKPRTDMLSPEDLERIAAFVDGTLTESERAEVTALLAASEDASSLLASVLELRESIGEHEVRDAPSPESRTDPTAPADATPRRLGWTIPRRMKLASAAVMVLSIVSIGVVLQGPRGPVAGSVMTARIDPVDPAAANAAAEADPLSVARGGGIPLSSESGSAFRVGTRAVGVETYLEADLPSAALRASVEMDTLLVRLAVPAATLATFSSTTVQGRRIRIPGPTSLDDLESLLTTRNRSLGDHFAFGVASEIVRLAAYDSDLPLLSARPGREFLRLAESIELSVDARADVIEIAGILRANLETAQLTRLVELLEAPMREAGR